MRRDLTLIKSELRKELVSSFSSALKRLMALLSPDSIYLENLVLLSAQFTRLESEYIMNLVSRENFTLERARLDFSFLKILGKVQVQDLKVENGEHKKNDGNANVRLYDTIKWLISNLEGYSFIIDGLIERGSGNILTRKEYSYNKVCIDIDGEVHIEENIDQIFSLHSSDVNIREKIITFNIKDIVNSEVELVDSYDMSNLFFLNLEVGEGDSVRVVEKYKSTTLKPSVGNKREGVLEDTDFLKYHLHFNSINKANRILKAFDFIRDELGGHKDLF